MLINSQVGLANHLAHLQRAATFWQREVYNLAGLLTSMRQLFIELFDIGCCSLLCASIIIVIS